jgi:hypothetical protein
MKNDFWNSYQSLRTLEKNDILCTEIAFKTVAVQTLQLQNSAYK